MAVLVPPSILDEMQAVFDLPMVTYGGLEFARSNLFRRATGHIVARFVKRKSAIGGANFVIEPDGDLTSREIQTLADILGVVQVEPYLAGILLSPLFSVSSIAGRVEVALAKHVFNASETSG
jgi:hypothetical protein